MRKRFCGLAAFALLAVACDNGDGRYQMATLGDSSVYRIDTRTGEVCWLMKDLDEVGGIWTFAEARCGMPGVMHSAVRKRVDGGSR